MPELEWDVAGDAEAGSSGPTLPPDVATSPTYRDILLAKVPQWLSRGVGGKFLYTMGLHMDALGDALAAAVKLRFPGLYTTETLPLSGQDRRIRRGRTETDEVYATRLIRWLDDHLTRGGPYAMLAQLHAHYAPTNFPIHLVYRSGRRFIMDASGAVTRDFAWQSQAEDWAQWQLFFFNGSTYTSDGLWSDPGTWSDGGVWDSTVPYEEVVDFRLVPREWNAAHCKGQIVLINGAVELWDYPQGLWSDPGVWGAIDDFPPTFSI